MEQLASNVLAKQQERRKDYLGRKSEAGEDKSRPQAAGKALKAQAPASGTLPPAPAANRPPPQAPAQAPAAPAPQADAWPDSGAVPHG